MSAQHGSHIINNLIVKNYLIHQQNLCSQVLSINHVILVVRKTVNYIRSHALPHQQFKEFLKELDSKYGYKNNNYSFCLFQIINTPKLIL
jgi:prephenate dehydratase